MFPSYNKFVEYFQKNFLLVHNILFHKNKIIKINYKKILDNYDIYYLFCRFKNSLEAFDFYRTIYDSQDDYDLICHLCDIYNYLYVIISKDITVNKMNKKIETINQEKDKVLYDLVFNMAYNWKNRAKYNIQALTYLDKEENILREEINIINIINNY